MAPPSQHGTSSQVIFYQQNNDLIHSMMLQSSRLASSWFHHISSISIPIPTGFWGLSFNYHTYSGWWFGCHFLFSHILGCCHHPNWRTHIFQRGGPGPPTSIVCYIQQLWIVIHVRINGMMKSPLRRGHRDSREGLWGVPWMAVGKDPAWNPWEIHGKSMKWCEMMWNAEICGRNSHWVNVHLAKSVWIKSWINVWRFWKRFLQCPRRPIQSWVGEKTCRLHTCLVYSPVWSMKLPCNRRCPFHLLRLAYRSAEGLDFQALPRGSKSGILMKTANIDQSGLQSLTPISESAGLIGTDLDGWLCNAFWLLHAVWALPPQRLGVASHF